MLRACLPSAASLRANRPSQHDLKHCRRAFRTCNLPPQIEEQTKSRVQEGTHYRTVISKFGGPIKVGSALSIPKQVTGELRPENFTRALEPCDGKGIPTSNVQRAKVGGWIVGYSGHRPKAREVVNTMAYGGVPLFHRMDESRFAPGQGQQLKNRNTTTWMEIAPEMKYVAPMKEVGGRAVPGYMGHVPHGEPTPPAQQEIMGPWGRQPVKMGWSAEMAKQRRPASSPPVRETTDGTPAHTRPHATDYKALDRSSMPEHMPLVGYAGHLRRIKDSTDCYGTSHWRPETPVSRAMATAMAYESAKQKAIDNFKPTFSGNVGYSDPYAGLLNC